MSKKLPTAEEVLRSIQPYVLDNTASQIPMSIQELAEQYGWPYWAEMIDFVIKKEISYRAVAEKAMAFALSLLRDLPHYDIVEGGDEILCDALTEAGIEFGVNIGISMDDAMNQLAAEIEALEADNEK